MLLIKLLGTVAQDSKRSKTSDSADRVQTTARVSSPRSCLRVSSSASAPPDGNTVQQGPSERESKQCSEKTRKKINHSCLLRLTDHETPYSTASSSSFLPQ